MCPEFVPVSYANSGGPNAIDGVRPICWRKLKPHWSGRFDMVLTADHIAPIVALIAGILILIVPRLLNYIVAVYLIVAGLTGLNGIYHFVG
jgi:Protein of unknown function (DUF3096)